MAEHHLHEVDCAGDENKSPHCVEDAAQPVLEVVSREVGGEGEAHRIVLAVPVGYMGHLKSLRRVVVDEDRLIPIEG